MELFLTARSEPLSKALAANSYAASFADLDALSLIPASAFPIGHGGSSAPDRVFLMPYGDGGAGNTFLMRLYGWRPHYLPSGIPDAVIWIPHLLVELSCTTCNKTGLAQIGGPNQHGVKEGDNFCDTILLRNGNVGANGMINSPASNAEYPISNVIATAKIDLAGCRYLSFDFQQVDPIGMNCLFAKA